MGKIKDRVFKMPVSVKITGRSSSITNAFYNGIIPVIEPSDEEVAEALETLGMTEETICCAYCGDPYTEWDHLNPLIKNKKPTGYITEIHNLVPSCGKCNQSKGNKDWKTWMLSDAALSPKTRKIPDIDERIRRLEEYKQKYRARRFNFIHFIEEDLWEQHEQNCEEIQKKMRESQKLADKIKMNLSDAINKQIIEDARREEIMIKVCANCKRPYREGDKYCRFCGAPMGKPGFMKEQFACLYGPPPVRRVHTCANCGHTWETYQMIDDERWCPECGGTAPVTSEEQ